MASYQTLENLLQHVDEIKGKVGENLREFIPRAALTKQLITIDCEVPLSIAVQDLSLKLPQYDKLYAYYSELEFKAWSKEATDANGNQQPTSKDLSKQFVITTAETIKPDQIITQPQQLQRWIEQLSQAKMMAFDTETTSLNYMEAELVGLSFAIDGQPGVYIPVAHNGLDAPKQLGCDQVLQQLRPLLESEELKKVGQNLKYDKEVLANYGIELKGIVSDTMLQSYVYNSTATRHDMDSLAFKYLEHQCIKYTDLCGSGAKQIPFSQVELQQAVPYAIEDAEITLQLYHYFSQKLATEKRLLKLLADIEIPMLNVLATIERNGVLVDCDYLKTTES